MIALRILKLVGVGLLCLASFNGELHALDQPLYDLLTCPYSPDTTPKSDTCKRHSSVLTVDPQNREIWVFAKISVSVNLLNGNVPIGLFVYGKAASKTYLNGELVGSNGVPGASASVEQPGKMYSVIHLPMDQLKVGSNTLALHLSSHHGWLNLHSPMHAIALSDYAQPRHLHLEKYWPSLLPFGLLVIGALYMGFLAHVRRDHWSAKLLPLMSMIAAIQLFAEVYRAFVDYTYPVHDLRLLLIFLCSIMFGAGALAHTAGALNVGNKRKILIIAGLLTLGCVILLKGFDTKSAAGLFVPVLISLVLAAYKAVKGYARARPLAIILAIFVCAMLLSPWLFLDITLFYIVAAFLLVLFFNQAQAYFAERKIRVSEQARADKLQAILEQKQRRDESGTIKISSAGVLELINIEDVIYCKGAGDYTELVLREGRTVLSNDRLRELENTLPSVFMRVHRSYIVNTTTIDSLTRKTSGVGELLLAGAHAVPVSRRIMPRVRDGLI